MISVLYAYIYVTGDHCVNYHAGWFSLLVFVSLPVPPPLLGAKNQKLLTQYPCNFLFSNKPAGLFMYPPDHIFDTPFTLKNFTGLQYCEHSSKVHTYERLNGFFTIDTVEIFAPLHIALGPQLIPHNKLN